MGDEKLQASIAHIVLCCVSGNSVRNFRASSYTHPGMHANFFIHGLLGFFNNQSELLGNDFKEAYEVSKKAARYLALPCLNAQLNRSDKMISMVHLLSGVIPFVISLAGEDNVPLGNLAIALNIISLFYYSYNRSADWGYYTAGTACLAYFVAPKASEKVVFPLALALMEYCAHRISFFG